MKWADFGLSNIGIKGTEYYFAPELLRSQVKKRTKDWGEIGLQ
jgi:hypothetical protein